MCVFCAFVVDCCVKLKCINTLIHMISVVDSLQGLLWLFGGTNPYPDAPTITPDDSTGPSAGGIGNCTGPYIDGIEKNETSID